MLVTRNEPQLTDWDAALDRAQHGRNAEDKLIRAIELMTSAQQRSRLRGERNMVTELAARLDRAHQLLDQI
jgi:hypothetical protein